MADQPYTGPEVDAAVRILREDAAAARDRALMARLDSMEQRMSRMPVTEMTAEEKAAEYDRMMKERDGGRPPAPSGGSAGAGAPGPGQPPAGKPDPGAPPPAPAAKPPAPPTEQPSKSWWDGYQNRGA